MGILGDVHGLDLIIAIQWLVGGPNKLIRLKYFSFHLNKKLSLIHFATKMDNFLVNWSNTLLKNTPC